MGNPPPPPRIRCEPFTPEELAALLGRLDQEYAADHARAGTWTQEEALARAKAETAQLLPQGLATPGQYLQTILDDDRGKRVGELWYGLREEGRLHNLWIWWVGIEPKFRQRGYGAAALRYVEERARELKADQVVLHVFGDNSSAQRVYLRAGFVVTNVIMKKRLGSPSGVPDGPATS